MMEWKSNPVGVIDEKRLLMNFVRTRRRKANKTRTWTFRRAPDKTTVEGVTEGKIETLKLRSGSGSYGELKQRMCNRLEWRRRAVSRPTGLNKKNESKTKRFQSQTALYKSKFKKVDTFANLPVFDRVKKKKSKRETSLHHEGLVSSPLSKFL